MNKPADSNRLWWDKYAEAYQSDHGEALARELLAWGVWRIPESEVQALGEVTGKDVLEYGCGAAQWAVGLARAGARVTGLDISEVQLGHARRRVDAAGEDVALVLGDGEDAPFGDESFDIVFCDHGVMTFCRPQRTVAEAARMLRPGGSLVFCMSSAWRDVCDGEDAVAPELRRSYFDDLDRLTYRDESGQEMVWHQLPYGDWIRLFRRHGFVVEDLIELRPPENAQTTYSDFVTLDWARRWPAESLWRLTLGDRPTP